MGTEWEITAYSTLQSMYAILPTALVSQLLLTAIWAIAYELVSEIIVSL